MDDQPVCITDTAGNKFWYLNGKRHRLDGPAVEYVGGGKQWWIHDQPHREDGPAVVYGHTNKSWYFRGKHINVKSQEEFEVLLPTLQIAEVIDD